MLRSLLIRALTKHQPRDMDPANDANARPQEHRKASSHDSSEGRNSNTTLPNTETPTRDLSPEDFLHQLRVDTAILSARGRIERDGHARELLEVRDRLADFGRDKEVVTLDVAGTEHELQVYPHGSNWHELLMRNEELEVKAVRHSPGMKNMPCLKVRFGARWWMGHDVPETRQFMRDLAEALGVNVRDYIISEVHICADHLHALTLDDVQHSRGYATRGNASRELHMDGRHFTGISKKGKGLQYTIYNKTREVKKQRKTHWIAHLRRYGINVFGNDHEDIWRAEVKAKREFLRNTRRRFSLDGLGTFNWTNLRRLWGYFTGRYLRFTKETIEEEARSDDQDWWDDLAKLAEEEADYKPPEAPAKRSKDRIDADFAQAVGCATSSLAKSGAARLGDWAASLISRVQEELAEGVEDRFEQLVSEELTAAVRDAGERLSKAQQEFYAGMLANQVREAFSDAPSSSTCTHRPFAYG